MQERNFMHSYTFLTGKETGIKRTIIQIATTIFRVDDLILDWITIFRAQRAIRAKLRKNANDIVL
jgi:hypothetical protein